MMLHYVFLCCYALYILFMKFFLWINLTYLHDKRTKRKPFVTWFCFFLLRIGMCPFFYDYLHIMGFSAFFIYIIKFYLSCRAVFVAHLCVCTHRCANNWKHELKPQFQVRNSVFLSWLQLLHTCVSVHTDVQQVLPYLTHTHTY